MLELKIKNIDDLSYCLVDKDNREYNLSIQFYDLIDNPRVGDSIYMNQNMLNSSKSFSFGSIMGKYGKNILEGNKEEIIVVKSQNELIFLKRYYG